VISFRDVGQDMNMYLTFFFQIIDFIETHTIETNAAKTRQKPQEPYTKPTKPDRRVPASAFYRHKAAKTRQLHASVRILPTQSRQNPTVCKIQNCKKNHSNQ
jgi:hypothetical protein